MPKFLTEYEKNVYLLKIAALFCVFLGDFSGAVCRCHTHDCVIVMHVLVYGAGVHSHRAHIYSDFCDFWASKCEIGSYFRFWGIFLVPVRPRAIETHVFM